MIARSLEAVIGTLNATGTCPVCKGNFETCTCTGGHAGRVGIAADDIRHGETEQWYQLVDRLVVDGDDRARAAGRRARRTLSEMAPGYERQPILHLTRPLPMAGANDACPLCHRWTCDRTNCPPSRSAVASAAAVAR
ncbi:hypothetical protein OG217_37225 (plasmid) [Streptomyces sp. NBC_01023]|uniref:hypothetical protein n=1 Tax=unclassified Streptomyces TaxID=2593676 RepID=UPI002F90C4F9|nr:hypothetical protein OG217_37225 [Streptomyces sp. NBC_01023]